MITDEQIDELERLEREATPGPWEVSTTAYGTGLGGNGRTIMIDDHDTHDEDVRDFYFCAAARNALPVLLAELRELRDCGQRGVCRTTPGCDHHWEERGPECEVCLACLVGEAVGK